MQNLPYSQQGDLIHLPNFPYDPYDGTDDADLSNLALAHCFTMWLRYRNAPDIECCDDYLAVVANYREEVFAHSHLKALSQLKSPLRLSRSSDEHIIKDEIKKGNPVVTSVFYGRNHPGPRRISHAVVITGYSNDAWLVHDPVGQLDPSCTYWDETGGESGKNVLYSFKDFNPRIFPSGGATGMCWIPLSKMKS